MFRSSYFISQIIMRALARLNTGEPSCYTLRKFLARSGPHTCPRTRVLFRTRRKFRLRKYATVVRAQLNSAR